MSGDYARYRLLYDLDDPAQVEDLRGEVRHARDGGPCLVQEALPSPEHAWLPGVGGTHHVVELVVSLGLHGPPTSTKSFTISKTRRPSLAASPETRLRPPGSDWLYLKLYSPRSAQEELLAGPVRELCREVDEARLADRWFFLRYADPQAHVRIRFQGRPRRLTEELVPRLCSWASQLLSDGACQTFAFDTYDRELERYGGPNAIRMAEAMFAADSRAVLELLAGNIQMDRTLLTIVTIDDLLDALGLNTEAARLSWLKQTITWRKEVGEEYRARRDQLISILQEPAQLGASVNNALAARRVALKPVAERLSSLESTCSLMQPLGKILGSFVHMHCNRLWADQAAERRALALLLRTRDTIAHKNTGSAKQQITDVLNEAALGPANS
jgi:thiopeptide-type bacteriocin biosynthesis protein